MSAPMRQAAERWWPPVGGEVEMVAAGRYWDAVKVASPAVAEAVLICLRDRSGAVIADPFAGASYWLVGVGSAAAWPALPTVTVLGADPRRTAYVGVPPVCHEDGPCPHWKVPVTASRYLTRAAVLLAALRTATRTVLP